MNKYQVYFLADTNCIEYPRSFVEFSHIFSSEFQQTWNPDITQLYTLSPTSSKKEESSELVEISPRNLCISTLVWNQNKRHK
jgi:hypothetical protein